MKRALQIVGWSVAFLIIIGNAGTATKDSSGTAYFAVAAIFLIIGTVGWLIARARKLPPRTWWQITTGRWAVTVTTLFIVLAAAGNANAATTPAPLGLFKNCSMFHLDWPHGAGRVGAHDKTSGTPVVSFQRSTTIYKLAVKNNPGLDRDGDGIACEAS